jgi:hypothetical protein
MLTFVQWSGFAAALALAGCAFEGGVGSEEPAEEPPVETPRTPEPAPGDGPVPPPAVVCEGFTEVGASYYLVTDDAISWNDSVARCGTYPGGYLATFETATEATELIAGLPLPSSVWTGVEQRVQGNTRVAEGWANRRGSARTALPGGFPWKTGEPNDGNGFYFEDNDENMAKLNPDGKFDDTNANQLNRALCECAPPVE